MSEEKDSLKDQLTPEEYYVTQNHGTEPAFSGKCDERVEQPAKNLAGTASLIASLASRLKASLSCNGLAVTLQMCQW